MASFGSIESTEATRRECETLETELAHPRALEARLDCTARAARSNSELGPPPKPAIPSMACAVALRLLRGLLRRAVLERGPSLLSTGRKPSLNEAFRCMASVSGSTSRMRVMLSPATLISQRYCPINEREGARAPCEGTNSRKFLKAKYELVGLMRTRSA